MTLATATFVFVSVVSLLATGAIVLLMLRDPRRGLSRLDHEENALPEVMAGRYFTFFVLTVLAVLYGDLRVMAGLQIAFLTAALADVFIYVRRGGRYLPHLLAAIAAAIAAGLCGFVGFTAEAAVAVSK